MADLSLQQRIEALFAEPKRSDAALALLAEVRRGLTDGSLRVAEPAEINDTGAPSWKVNVWIKQALLLMSSLGALELRNGAAITGELDTLPWTQEVPEGCRVPKGSSLREGSYLAPGVVCLPPAVVQIGSHIGRRTAVDSFVSVGIGAQVGAGVQLSCRSTVGGWLLPLTATPTIVEDGAILGVGSGVYDGARIGEGAVLLAGTRIIPSAGLYDLRRDALLPSEPGVPLSVPPFAIVAMGSRPEGRGLMLEVPVIVGRRIGNNPAEWESYTEMRFAAPE